jgi:hypothetical protein
MLTLPLVHSLAYHPLFLAACLDNQKEIAASITRVEQKLRILIDQAQFGETYPDDLIQV